MKKRKPDAKARELASDWDKLVKAHSQPLTTKPKRVSFGDQNPMALINRQLTFHADRIPKPNRPDPFSGEERAAIVKESLKQQLIETIGREEYERRESEAREINSKRTVMPMHKSNYIVVTEPEIMRMVGKKTA